MSSINFVNVYLLFIALPLVALLSVPFILAVRKNNVNGHNIASLAIHVLMAVLIAFAAAGTSVVTTVTETNVYVVADVSYSANRNLDIVDKYIKDISLPKNTRMGVICFGKNYRLLTKLGERFNSVKDAKGVDDSETDIVGALEYAGSLFRDGVIKRIVLVTDGMESYSGDSNALKRTIDNLNADDIHVDAIFVDDNITDGTNEVQVSSVQYTSNAYLGRKETVTAVIQSGVETDVMATLYNGETELEKLAPHLSAGVNTVSFENLITSESGTYGYTIKVEAAGDINPRNNSISFKQNVTDNINILLVTQNTADYNAVLEIYENADYIYAPLLIGERVPYSIEELCKYDEIIISGTDVSNSVVNYEMFLESVDKVVSLFGKSLLTIGDTGIQNDYDGKLKRLDNMLPVNYGNGNQDAKLYTLVLDISRSMNQLGKWSRAQNAALQLIDFLNDEDKVCIVAFYGSFETLYFVADPTAPLNKEAAKNTISSIGLNDLEQGTMLSCGLSEAFDKIKDLSIYSEKQLMLISDGLSYTGESDNPLDITRNMRSNGIITSVIDVGRGAANDSTSANAKQLLENIAAQGGGSYYLANTDAELDGIIFGDIADDLNESVVERSTAVKINKRRDEAVEGITSFTHIDGYVNSKEKASADTVLNVDYFKSNGGSVSVPLYAHWSYGNGKVASFTSSLSSSWITPWKGENGIYKQFFTNVINALTPDEKIDCPFVTEVREENGYSAITVTPATVRMDAVAQVSVKTPSGETVESPMAFDSSVYSYNVLTPAEGDYEITVTYKYAETDYVSVINLTVSYLPEYNSFAVYEASGLNRVIGGGTVSENGKLTLVNDDKEMGVYTVSLVVPLLIASVVLFAVDICVRKLRWSDIKSLFKKVNK